MSGPKYMKLTIFLSIVNCHKSKYISYSVSKWLDFTVITFFAFVISLSVWQNQFCVKLMWASADFSLLCVFLCIFILWLRTCISNLYLYFGCCLKVFKGTKQVKSEKSPLLRKEKVKKRKFPMLCTPPSRPPTPSGCCEDCSKSLKAFKGSKQVKSENSPLTLSCLHLLIDHQHTLALCLWFFSL